MSKAFISHASEQPNRSDPSTSDREQSNAPGGRSWKTGMVAGSGEPLDGALRHRFEQSIGADLGDIRLHRDARAGAAARDFQAAAFTVGRSIVMRPEHYSPGSFSTELLLAHELVHAEQNRRHSKPAHQAIASSSTASEAQARDWSHRIVQGEQLSHAAFSPPGGMISLAPETWFRGDIENAVRPGPGSNLHDLGDGLYLTDNKQVAETYASTRASEGARRGTGGVARVRSVTFERASLGRVLDLTTDSRWLEYVRKPIAGMTPEQMIKRANENYSRFFGQFVSSNKIDLSKYDAIIGPEYVRGGKQICIRNPAKIAEIERLLAPIPRTPSGGGSGGSGQGGSGAKDASSKPKPAAPPKRPTTGGSSGTAKSATSPTPERASARPATSAAPDAPKPATPPRAPTAKTSPFTIQRPVYASRAVQVGARVGAAVATPILLGWMWSSMKKSAAETPSPKREVKEAGGFLKAIRKPDSLKSIDLVSTTMHEYANKGFGEERANLTLEFFKAYAAIDAIQDVSQRRAAIYALIQEALASANELSTMRDNVDQALKLEKDFQKRIDAAVSLESTVLQSSGLLIMYAGIPVEDVSQILSNLKWYAATFRLTLEALKKLKVSIGEAHSADWQLIRKLTAAHQRGCLAGKRTETKP